MKCIDGRTVKRWETVAGDLYVVAGGKVFVVAGLALFPFGKDWVLPGSSGALAPAFNHLLGPGQQGLVRIEYELTCARRRR